MQGRMHKDTRAEFNVTLNGYRGLCAMLVFVRQLRRIAPASGLTAALTWTCAAMLALGMANILAPVFVADAEFRDHFRDALEWQLVTLFTLWFLVLARVIARRLA